MIEIKNGLDYVLLGLLAWGTVHGFQVGFVMSAISLAGLVAAWLAAGRLTPEVIAWSQRFDLPADLPPLLLNLLVFVLLFFAARFLFQLAGLALHRLAGFGPLMIINRLAGAVFGLLRQGLILALCFGLLTPLLRSGYLPKVGQIIDESAIATTLLEGFYRLTPVLLQTIN